MIKSENILKCNNCEFWNPETKSSGYITINNFNVVFHFYDMTCPDLVINKGSFITDCFLTKEENFIKNIELIPRDPIIYSDWKVGDKVVFKNDQDRSGEVIFISGNYIVISDENQDAVGYDKRKFNKYFELVLTDIEEELLNLDDDFKEDDPVVYKDYHDDRWKLGHIHDTYKNRPTVKHILQVRDVNDEVHIIRRENIRHFDEETWHFLK